MRVNDSIAVVVFRPFVVQFELTMLQPALQVILSSVTLNVEGDSPAEGVGWGEKDWVGVENGVVARSFLSNSTSQAIR